MRPRMAAVLGALAGVLMAAAGVAAQSGEEAAGIERIQRLFNQRDYEGAYLLADSLVRVFPRSLTLKNRWLSPMSIIEPGDRPKRLADSLLKAFPDSLMAQANIGILENKEKEALAVTQRLRALAPWDPNTLASLAWSLRQTENGPLKAVALLDSALAHGPRSSILLWDKAAALLDQNYPSDSTGATAQAAELAREAIRVDSMDVGGHLMLGSALQKLGDRAGSYAAYKRAAQIAPLSAQVHRDYWNAALRTHPDRAAARQEIVADIRAMVAARPKSPYGLRVAAATLEQVGDTTLADSLRDRVVAMDPNGYGAEVVFLNRIDRLRQSIPLSSKPDSLRREQVRLLREFIARPVHHWSGQLQSRRSELLLMLAGDSTSDPQELERLGDAVLQEETSAFGNASVIVARLTDRGVALDLAERFARAMPAWGAAMDSLYKARKVLSPDQTESWQAYIKGMPHDALGWVAFKRGHLAEAETELKKAMAVAPKVVPIAYHAGMIAEARGRPAEAERFYMLGYKAERTGPSRDSEKALRRLYAAKHGSEEGFQQFISGLQEKERAERKQSVLGRRLKAPRPMPSFRLASLAGDTVSSAITAGKVAVVNFWGVWCGPCVAELPHIQKAYENYRSDPGVVFLTVDSGDELATVKEYLAKKVMTLPVLMDNRFTDRANVHGFPTTWFVGKDGRIAFEVVGGSDTETITEEFGWRIEALKAAGK